MDSFEYNENVEEAVGMHFEFGAFVTLLGMAFAIGAYFYGAKAPEAFVVVAMLSAIPAFVVGTGIRSDIR